MVHALEKPEVALGAFFARDRERARIRSSVFIDNSRASPTATRADLVASSHAVRRMMCKPLSESTTPDISPTASA